MFINLQSYRMNLPSVIYVTCVCISLSLAFEYHDFESLSFRTSLSPVYPFSKEEKAQSYWKQVALDELQNALSLRPINRVAKNVILFLGDGMSLPTATVARIYLGQKNGKPGEEGLLSFEKFPYMGLSKTYNIDRQVADSAGTATAFLSGIKTNMGVVGADASVDNEKCETMTNDSVVYSIAKWAQDANKRTGFVTTTRVTHATPSCVYAHSPSRNWECDAFLPENYTDSCPHLKDIARQLIENDEGKRLNVIMGGGFQALDGSAVGTPDDPLSDACVRADGRQLWKEWIDGKLKEKKTALFVRSKTSLDQVDLQKTEFLMGIFANSHLPFEYIKRNKDLDIPTLSEMTEAAIDLLGQGNNGFFLLVEGGRIDHGHHDGKAKAAIDETIAFHEAVEKAVQKTNIMDTLIVVTADHAHTMSMAGYPERGTDIFGFADVDSNKLPFTTLSYANGPGFKYEILNGEVVRVDITSSNISDYSYKQQATVPLKDEAHGGDDVAIYARGPMAHLFHSVHEQNYIAHVMAYAACIGDYRDSRCMESHDNEAGLEEDSGSHEDDDDNDYDD